MRSRRLNQLDRWRGVGRRGLALLLCSLLWLWAFPAMASERYQLRDRPDPDGIGKVYLGREIAQIKSHRGAHWLERPSRQWEEHPQAVLAGLHLRPTDVVADLGAGSGYFSFRLSALVPAGQVLAVDVQPEMVAQLQATQQARQLTNVVPILAELDDPHLPARSVDLVLMVDAYHEFAYPYEVMQRVVEALKPDGRVVLVEYRGENPLIPIRRLHKMTQRQVKREMAAVGLRWLETQEQLPLQHLMIFGQAARVNSVGEN